MTSGIPVGDLLRLTGRTAVVTGGARGIGAAVAYRLHEAGASVVTVDVEPVEARSLAVDGAVHLRTDILEAGALEDVADRTVERFGSLDIWVSNAGIYPSAAVADINDAMWDEVLDLNLKAVFQGARAASRQMRLQADGGVIVNIASNAGMAAGPSSAHYVASKHGVVGLTKALAVDLADVGIRVVGIAPGVTATEGIDSAAAALRAAGWGDLTDYAARSTPLGRMADPDEIARVVLFAASKMAAFVSGTTIVVDGGQLSSFT